MLYRYKDLKDKYGNNYQINKKIALGKLIKREDGLYADNQEISFMDVIAKKYPEAVITDLTAYYCYNLYEVNPPVIHVATQRDTTKINDSMIKQHFVVKKIYQLGIVSLNISNSQVKVYDKEKLLIELIRNKDKYAITVFNKIINNYQKIIDQLDFKKIDAYLAYYPNGKRLNGELKKYV